MFFTQEDYRKIQEWLQRNSVKDTEFQEADIPLNGREVITLVQNGHNKRVYLKDLVEQMFSIGIADFVNVSSLHDKYNITLNEAIQLVPHNSRKKGQVITFCNTDNVWKIYQFTGVKNQWNILDLWNDLFDWTTILDVNFGPDEEDITANKNEDNIKLSFKDRVYEPASHSGLGYKILRKNIITYNDPVQGELTKNILVQNKVAQSNTIYEIRYDFDLNNQTIHIPEGCVLQYKGGSLSNGTLVYTDTIIEGAERLSNVNIEGNYRYPYTGDDSNPDSQLAPTMTQFRRLNNQVNNIADDEDLTKIYDDEKGQEVLQLKDRQYVQGSNSGMGYVILRQNKSFKEQLTQSNTIYEIRYDFDLSGEEVEIPENCVLKFEGGRMSNGSIVSTNLNIASAKKHIFNNITFSNDSLSIQDVYPEWFGAKRDGLTDSTDALQSAIDMCENNGGGDVILQSGKYLITSTLKLKANVGIRGVSARSRKMGSQLVCKFENYNSWAIDTPAIINNEAVYPPAHDVFYKETLGDAAVSGYWSVSISDVYIVDDSEYAIYGAIRLFNTLYSSIKRVNIKGFAFGIFATAVWDFSIRDCYVRSSNGGFGFGWLTTTAISNNCYFTREKKTLYDGFVEPIFSTDEVVQNNFYPEQLNVTNKKSFSAGFFCYDANVSMYDSIIEGGATLDAYVDAYITGVNYSAILYRAHVERAKTICWVYCTDPARTNNYEVVFRGASSGALSEETMNNYLYGAKDALIVVDDFIAGKCYIPSSYGYNGDTGDNFLFPRLTCNYIIKNITNKAYRQVYDKHNPMILYQNLIDKVYVDKSYNDETFGLDLNYCLSINEAVDRQYIKSIFLKNSVELKEPLKFKYRDIKFEGFGLRTIATLYHVEIENSDITLQKLFYKGLECSSTFKNDDGTAAYNKDYIFDVRGTCNLYILSPTLTNQIYPVGMERCADSLLKISDNADISIYYEPFANRNPWTNAISVNSDFTKKYRVRFYELSDNTDSEKPKAKRTIQDYDNVRLVAELDNIKGATENRPNIAEGNSVGAEYYDTTLAKPIYWTGTKWVDSTGGDV